MSGTSGGRRLGLAPGRIASHVRSAVGLAVRAAPGRMAGYAVGTILAAVLPVAAALLTRSVVDGLVDGTASGVDWRGSVGALAVVGLLVGFTPAILAYLRADLERAIALLAKDRLFRAVDGV